MSSIDRDQLNLEAFRLPQNYASLGIKTKQLTIPLRKPEKHQFFRTHPVWNFAAPVLKLRGERRDAVYVLHAVIADMLPDDHIPMMFIPAITRQGALTLWGIRLPTPDGREDDWSRTAMMAAIRAQTQWIRLVPDMGIGAYKIQEPIDADAFPEPQWPDEDWAAILQLAFRDHVIEDRDHPVLRELRGEK